MKFLFSDNKVYKWLLYVVLMMLAVISFIHWSGMKEIYYADEVYTYESVNGIEQEWPRYIGDEWMGSDRIVSYLAADSEYMAFDQISMVLYGDHVPLFFWLTRFISVTFFRHQATTWIVYASSIVFYISLLTVVFFVLNKIVGKPFVSFLMVSFAMVYNRVLLEQTTMLRMYIMLLFLDVMLLILGLYIMKDSDAGKLSWWKFAALTIVSLSGLLTHYDFWIFYAITAFCICLYMFVMAIKEGHKKWYGTSYFKNVLCWVASFGVSIGITIYLFPYCIWNLHKDKGWTALTSVSNISGSKFGNIIWGFKCLSQSVFSKVPSVIGVIVIVAAFAVAVCIMVKGKEIVRLKGFVVTLVIAFLYQFAVCFTLPDAREERYVWCSETVLALCLAYSLYLIASFAYKKVNENTGKRAIVFGVTLVVSVLLFISQYREIDHGKGISYLYSQEKDIQALKDNSDIPWIVYGPCEAHSFYDFIYSSEVCFMSNASTEADYEAAKYLENRDSFLIYAYDSQVDMAETFFEDALSTELDFTYLTKSTNYCVYLVTR